MAVSFSKACFHSHPSDKGNLHIPDVCTDSKTQHTHLWFGFLFCESEISPSSLVDLKATASPLHTHSFSLFVGFSSVSCYFSSTWSMMCSNFHFFPISVGLFPQIVSSMFLRKRKWKVSTYGGEWLQRQLSLFCLLSKNNFEAQMTN